MLLAIEQGNTNTLFAVHDGESWIAQWRTATEASRTADEYAVWLTQLLAMRKIDLASLTGCIISSVVPQSIFNLRNLARRYLSVEPLVIGDNVEPGRQMPRRQAPKGAEADQAKLGPRTVHPASVSWNRTGWPCA
jgi:type III pantothenate kinase